MLLSRFNPFILILSLIARTVFSSGIAYKPIDGSEEGRLSLFANLVVNNLPPEISWYSRDMLGNAFCSWLISYLDNKDPQGVFVSEGWYWKKSGLASVVCKVWYFRGNSQHDYTWVLSQVARDLGIPSYTNFEPVWGNMNPGFSAPPKCDNCPIRIDVGGKNATMNETIEDLKWIYKLDDGKPTGYKNVFLAGKKMGGEAKLKKRNKCLSAQVHFINSRLENTDADNKCS
ncbi:unnamed protein product [Cunninghamella blakesleeana]